MHVLIDHQRCPSEATSVGEAVTEAARSLKSRGRILVEVVVDGVAWGEEELRSVDQCATCAEEVRLVSEDLTALIASTLSDASAALVEADAEQRRAAALIQADRTHEAFEILHAAIDTWKTVHDTVVTATEALALDLDTVQVGEESVAGSIDRLSGHLRSLRSALREQDPVGLSDTLLYELPEAVTEWRGVLEALDQHLHAEAEDDRDHAPAD